MSAQQQSALRPSQRLRVAYILTLVGGFLDAYTYFKRGGVFANAQTGNIVKLGIALANGAQDKYLFYLIPILSFSAGLLAALAVAEVLERVGKRLIRRSVLAAEIAGLVVVSLIPLGEEWNLLANCIVTFVAAMQYETFTTFHGEAIVTTVSTGNLRKTIDSLFRGVAQRDNDKIFSSVIYLTMVCTFAFGAYLGTLSCNVWNRAALLPVILALAVTIGIITALRQQGTR